MRVDGTLQEVQRADLTTSGFLPSLACTSEHISSK
jgi:hypothetical protein